MIIWGNGTGVNDFLSRRIFGRVTPMQSGTYLAVTRGDELAGAVLFHDYHPEHGTVELSAAGNPGWVSRAVLFEIGDYVFDQMGCQAAVMRSNADNERVSRLLQSRGLKRYDIPRLRGADKGEAVYILTVEDWRAFKKE